MSRTKDWTYLRNRAKLRKDTDICWLCGHWIDPELKFPHPKSFSADHLIPLYQGGHNNGELRAAHLDCNRSRNATKIKVRHSRRW